MVPFDHEPGTRLVTEPRATAPSPSSMGTGAKRQRVGTRRLARGALALVFVVGAATSLLPWGRAAARGVLLLPPVLTTSQSPAFVATGEEFRHTSLTVPYASGSAFLDVYEPSASAPAVPGARGGILILPGVFDERQDPGLVNLDESLARSGVVVMNLTTQTLIDGDLAAADSDAVVQAFDKLAHWPGVGPDRVGIVGISGAGAIACLAAIDGRIRSRIAFLTLFGSYYDAQELLQDIGRQAFEVDGKLQRWQPAGVPLAVLANVLAPLLPTPDGDRVAAAFNGATPNPLTPDEVALLSPAGAAAYHLLAGDAPGAVGANIALLLPLAGDLLETLSPSAVVDQIQARIYLLHSRDDQFVPFTQSREFDAALTRLHHPHEYAELSIFQHTEVRTGLSVGPLLMDSGRLAHILYAMILVGS